MFQLISEEAFSGCKALKKIEFPAGVKIIGDNAFTRCGLSGREMRSLFLLRSADFDVVYDGESFVFTVFGFGHGVGMSQYGANLMAKAGCDYRSILSHYYPGTKIQ